jgi:hypothetical protein
MFAMITPHHPEKCRQTLLPVHQYIRPPQRNFQRHSAEKR